MATLPTVALPTVACSRSLRGSPELVAPCEVAESRSVVATCDEATEDRRCSAYRGVDSRRLSSSKPGSAERSGTMVMSMRRFWALPSTVPFEATGRVSA